MNIRNEKKVKRIDNLKALLQDAKRTEKVSLFGSFILFYIAGKNKGIEFEKEITKLYKGLASGYQIPKHFILVFNNKNKMIEKKGKITLVNIKAFNRFIVKETK